MNDTMNNTLTRDNVTVNTRAPRMTDRQINMRIRKYAELDTRRKALEKEAATIKKELDALLLDLTNGTECVIATGKCMFTLHYIATSAIDSTRLKKELPDIATAYTKIGRRKDIGYAVK